MAYKRHYGDGGSAGWDPNVSFAPTDSNSVLMPGQVADTSNQAVSSAIADATSPADSSSSATSGGGLAALLRSITKSPLGSALLGAGLGYLGGGKSGAIGGALMGPSLGAKIGDMPSGSGGNLDRLVNQYLPLLMAQYAGSFYRNPSPKQAPLPAHMNASLPTAQFNRAANPYVGNWYTYGQAPSSGGFYTGNQLPSPSSVSNLGPQAHGGAVHGGGALAGVSRYVKGPGDGTSDDINAKLSDGEYVVPAHVVAALGNGSSDAGARKLDRLQSNVRKRVGKQMAGNEHPKPANDPEDYMEEE